MDARKAFVTSGGLKKIQEIQVLVYSRCTAAAPATPRTSLLPLYRARLCESTYWSTHAVPRPAVCEYRGRGGTGSVRDAWSYRKRGTEFGYGGRRSRGRSYGSTSTRSTCATPRRLSATTRQTMP
eukprot:943232-Rhodomonas_salina.1